MCVWGGGGEDENPRIGSKVRSPMLEKHTLEGTDSEPSGEISATHHKSRETTMPEDPEDTLMSSGGSKTSSKDHQA